MNTKVKEKPFRCKVCGKSYEKQEKVDNCKSKHVFPKRIVEHNFRPKEQYPSILIVEMEDGNVIAYDIGIDLPMYKKVKEIE